MKALSPQALLTVARRIVLGLLFFLPLFFLPITIDLWEVNKQTFLVVGVLCASLCWLGSAVLSKKITVRGGWWILLPLPILVATIISAFFSKAPYVSFAGSMGQEYMSVAMLFGLTLLFFLCLQLIDTPKREHVAIVTVACSAVLAGVVGICAVFGFSFIPAELAQARTFNTVGTMNTLAIFLAAITVLCVSYFSLQKEEDKSESILTAVLAGVALCLLILLDYWILWATLIVGLAAMLVAAMLRPHLFPNPKRLFAPTALVAIAISFLAFLPNPFPVSSPSEVTLGSKTSWEIAVRTLNETSFFWGSGPGTYLFQYMQHRPESLNATVFWNTSFDRASSFALTILTSLGVIGAIAWTLFGIGVLACLARELLQPNPSFRTVSLGSVWIALLFSALLYPFNGTLLFLLFVVAAFLSGQVTEHVFTVSLQKKRADIYGVYGAVGLVSLLLVTSLFLIGQRYAAEVAFAKAVRLDRQGGDLVEVTRLVDRAAVLNRFEDAYYRTLAQALLLQLGQQAQMLKDDQELSADREEYVQALAAASVNAAIHAAELSPYHVSNWLSLGRVYREILPLVADAGSQAVTSFERALHLEPASPINYTELGETYLAIALEIQRLSASQSEEEQAQAEVERLRALAKAETALNHAVELKPDYAPAHFQLGLVYEQQGRLNDAIGKMESVVMHNAEDVGAAFQLGLLYLRRLADGDGERAQQQFERAITLAPSFSNARWFLATVYEQQGNLAGAVEQIEKVADLDPENEIVTSRLDRLRAGILSSSIPPSIE